MWTRGPDKEQPGKFAYELWNERDMVERVGGFDTAQEADRAAEAAQRRQLFPQSSDALPDDIANMSNEELLAELGL